MISMSVVPETGTRNKIHCEQNWFLSKEVINMEQLFID